MRGFLHGSKIIAQEKGIRGFFQGFLPTTARQAANSAVRFSSYTSLKQLAQSYTSPGEKLGAFSTFGLGGLAGIITVYTTMPIDTVKTRMQSIEASAQYKNIQARGSIDILVWRCATIRPSDPQWRYRLHNVSVL
jgi:solute carrier family 25 citrate transporter 1